MFQINNGYTHINIEYDYDAMGMKLREKDITGSGTTRTDYCGNVIYNNMAPTLLLMDNGYVTLSDNKYHFYYKDHEGNNRVIADQSNTVEQVNNYYPFGLSYKNDASTSANKYKYNGKELQPQHGLDWYDYGARFYDPELCQWHAIDPSCEKYYDVSPYAYCYDEPIRHIDILGKDEWGIDQKTGRMLRHIPTKEHDALYIVNGKGERIKGESLTMKYGSISGYHTLKDEKGEVAYYIVSNNNIAKKAFELLAKNTEVEWSNSLLSKKGSNIEENYLTTSYNAGEERGSSDLLSQDATKADYIPIRLIHSHPNDEIMPSFGNKANNEGGDINFAKWVYKNYGLDPTFNIYLPHLDQYEPFSRLSTPAEFPHELPEIIVTNEH